MKKLLLLIALCFSIFLLSACRYKIVDTYKEREKEDRLKSGESISGDVTNIEEVDEEKNEEVKNDSETFEVKETYSNYLQKDATSGESNKRSVYDWIGVAKLTVNQERPEYNTYSEMFESNVRVGTKDNPIKVGEVGLCTSITSYKDKTGTYGNDTFLKVTGRMTDEEVEEMISGYYADNPSQTRNEDFTWTGVNCEIDFNNNYGLELYYWLDMDKRLSFFPIFTVESTRYSSINGVIFKCTVDDDNIRDNKFQIIFSQYKEKDENALLKFTCFKGDTQYPDDYFYTFFEI